MEEALFRHVYGNDGADETIASFYALLGKIPQQIKELWGYETGDIGGLAATVDRRAVIEDALEGD